MSDISEKISELVENSKESNLNESRLNSKIAIIVAISASLMAIFNIKDNNIVQAMSQAQAHTIDAWSYYQAKSTKQHIAENNLNQLQIQLLLNEKTSPEVKKKIQLIAEETKTKIEKYEKEKTEIKKNAEAFQREYDTLNIHDDQFDLAEALISLGLSIFGITALVQKKPLFYFGIILSSLGAFFGLAGFLSWSIHPEWLTQILG